MILIYSVKNYYVLKMNKNKKEIQYILKFYYKKGKNATLLIHYINSEKNYFSHKRVMNMSKIALFAIF